MHAIAYLFIGLYIVGFIYFFTVKQMEATKYAERERKAKARRSL